MPVTKPRRAFRGIDRQRLRAAHKVMRMLLLMDTTAQNRAAKLSTTPILFQNTTAVRDHVYGVLERIDTALLQKS